MTFGATQISLWRKAIVWAPIRSLGAASSRECKLQLCHYKRNAVVSSFSTTGSTILQHRPGRKRKARREEMVHKMLHRNTFMLNHDAGVTSDQVEPFVLVVLNHDIPKFMPVLWRQAGLRICADGGANRLYDELLALLPGEHPFDINSVVEGPHCGLIPFGTTSKSTTTIGLHWNLNESEMAFGSMISTSNLLADNVVTVVSDCSLVWTVTIRPSV
ncbi:hypothetical protein R1flu_015948 [Riccia fluitans]|uniref:Thiamin pyrophosphokinase thiamin-binding domain-containing protein n=1 Tax=Riccia fluitans TaxID=41844 RepID=A0ABD1YKG5_9MARC